MPIMKKWKTSTTTFDTTKEPDLGLETEVKYFSSDESAQLVPKFSICHELEMSRFGIELEDGDNNMYLCNGFGKETVPDGGEVIWRCNDCDFDHCQSCVTKR